MWRGTYKKIALHVTGICFGYYAYDNKCFQTVKQWKEKEGKIALCPLFLLSQVLNKGILSPQLQISSYSIQALTGSSALMLMVMAKTSNETHNTFFEKEITGVWKCKISVAVCTFKSGTVWQPKKDPETINQWKELFKRFQWLPLHDASRQQSHHFASGVEHT